MAGFLWYRDTTHLADSSWNQLAIHELVEVSYLDEVYKPAVCGGTIQNRTAAGGVSQSSINHDGGDGSSTDGELIVSKTAHGLRTSDRITVSAESTGEVPPRVYEVEKISANTFYLRHFTINPWTNQKHAGSEVTRITGNGTGGTLSYVPTGKYSIESVSVANPDFTMGQEIIYWQMPDKFTTGGPYSHDGAHPLIVTSTGHGYPNGRVIQIGNESSGAVPDGEYQVTGKTTNTYRLRHIKSKEELNGVDVTPRITGTLNTYIENNQMAFPLFYGTITSLEETWTPSYGKIIKFEAKDNLQFFSNTTVKKIQKSFRAVGEKIGSADHASGENYHMGSGLKAPVYLDGEKVDGSSNPTETKISDALSNIVEDFNEGAGLIYTNNNNGKDLVGVEKFEDSGFQMSNGELQSGQFKRDLTDVGHKVLRAMQDMAMSDRHVTATGSGNDVAWAATGGDQPVVVTSSGCGLTTGQMIAVTDSSVGGGMYVPNGYYNVKMITSGTFHLYSLDGSQIKSLATAASGTLDWEGAEDGNFGYDFYLDSGIYGQPTSYGYQVAGVGKGGSALESESFDPRPHINYFKRGYRQFRPDATSLNIVSPVEEDIEETGQIRIMYPNSQWKIGDDEIISDVELQITGDDSGDTDKSELGHNLQLLRVKKIQCCNNVDAFTQRLSRLNHGGRWNGEFHWNRHDSFAAKDITDSTEKYETLVGANDQAMFCKSSGDLSTPGWVDNIDAWGTSIVGSASDGWGATAGTPYGSVNDREVLRRVLVNGSGGVGIITANTEISAGGTYEGSWKISGYSGPSEVPLVGRTLNKGPGDPAIVERYHDSNPAGEAAHTYPHYSTGIVDCDLIKSIKNSELEGLMEPGNFAGFATVENDGGSMLVSHVTTDGGSRSVHNIQTGGMIKITAGNSYDANNYWNNYKRVETPLPPAGWAPIASAASGTLKVNISPSDTSVVLESGDGDDFPSTYFLIRVGADAATYETMWCTSRSGDTLTVTRAEIKTSEYGGAPRSHIGSDSGTGVAVVLDRESYNIVAGASGVLNNTKFYLTNLPNEAYDGVPTPPTAGPLTKMPYAAGGITAYRRVFNVFDGAGRIQYQSSKTRTEEANSDNYVLLSDRARMDIPYMGVEVYAVADEDRKSSDTTLAGLTKGAATMPDTVNYAGSPTLPGVGPLVGLVGGIGRTIDGVSQYNAMPVRFRKGDKLSETRFLMREDGTPSTVKHLFKNTQAIISQALMEDKKRAKTQSLTYAMKGNDFNEVRRTAASLLTRTSKDLIRGSIKILRYPFITLTGVAGSGSSGQVLEPTQNVGVYGGRAGMMVTKTNGLDGEFQSGVLAEHINGSTGFITGTLHPPTTWSSGTTHYRMYVHLRAGHSVRVSDPLSSVAANVIITKLKFTETPSQTMTDLEVIGYQDLPTGVPVRPLGTITKAVVENKGDLSGPITLGKARLNQITFSSGDP